MMTPRELLKLACSGSVYVFRIVRDKDGVYVLKRMRALMYPSWEKVASAGTEKGLQLDIELYRHRALVILASKKLSSSDFDCMKKAGFRVFRKSGRGVPSIEEYVEESRRWRTFKKFPSVSMMDCFLSGLLDDNHSLLVN